MNILAVTDRLPWQFMPVSVMGVLLFLVRLWFLIIVLYLIYWLSKLCSNISSSPRYPITSNQTHTYPRISLTAPVLCIFVFKGSQFINYHSVHKLVNFMFFEGMSEKLGCNVLLVRAWVGQSIMLNMWLRAQLVASRPILWLYPRYHNCLQS